MSGTTPLDDYLRQYPDTRYLDVLICDLCCIMRGKRYPASQAGKVFSHGMMSPGSTCLLSVTGESMDPCGMGFSDGDPDEMGIPLPGTLVPVPWSQVPAAQVLLTLQGLDGAPYYYEPRNVLKRVLGRFSDLGLRPVVALELEFYLLAPELVSDGLPVPASSPATGMRMDSTQVYNMEEIEEFSLVLDDITSSCTEQGITTGAISREYSPGQFEINLAHSDNPLEAADHCVMFRRVVQGVAYRHGYKATFMAKPRPDLSGSGLHLHLSLYDSDGTNVLDGGGKFGTGDCASQTLKHCLGGLLSTLPECMGILAPNVNSYKRFIPNHYVPVTPSWGFENRSVALRIPKGPAQSRRMEHRVSGADANPYLALSVALAAMHYGISHGLSVDEPATGNAGSVISTDIPFDLAGTMHCARHSEFLADYLGKDYVEVYTECKLRECEQHLHSGEKEVKWYL